MSPARGVWLLHWLRLTLLGLVWVGTQNLFSQDDTTGSTEQPDVTVEAIESLRQQAASSTDLDAETKQKIEAACSAALEGLRKVKELAQSTSKDQNEAKNVATRVLELRDKLTILQQLKPDPPTGLDLPQLEQEVSTREVEVAKLKAALAKAETEPASRVTRRSEIRKLLLTADQALANMQSQIDMPPPANEPPLLSTARRAALKVNRMLLTAQIPAAQNELAKYDAEDSTDFLRLKRDILARQADLAERELKALQDQLNKQRAADSANKLKLAREDITKAPEAIRSHAEENVVFAEEAHQLTAPIQETNRKLESARTRLEEIQKQFKLVEQRVKQIGLTGSIGAMLRRQQTELPDLRALRKNVQDRKTLTEDLQYKSYEFDDLRSKSVEEELQRILRGIPVADRTPELEANAKAIINKRREFLDDVIRNYKSYLDSLFDLDATEQLLIREAQRYKSYIDERVLWIRSNKPLYAAFEFDSSDLWAFDAENWISIGNKFQKDLQDFPFLYLPAGIIFFILLWKKPKFRRELESLGAVASRGSCTDFTPSLLAGYLTLMLAVAWPGLIFFLAWRLNVTANGTPFARALAQSLFAITLTFFPLEILRRICRPKGLADSHFGWPDPMAKVLRTNIRWFLPFAVIVAFITSLLYYSEQDHAADSIERIAFLGGMLLFTIVLHRIFHPVSGVSNWYHAQYPARWFGRLKRVWYWFGVTIPATMAVLTIIGYYYTAQRLTWVVYTTFLFLLVIQILRCFLERWLTLQRRAISIEQARERLAGSTASANSSEANSKGVDQLVKTEDLQQEVTENTEQTQRLIQTGFLVTTVLGIWIIWVDVLPALKMLDKWAVWTTTVPVAASQSDGVASMPGATGLSPSMASTSVSTSSPTEAIESVTLADIGLALIIGFVTFVCARNVPGLMEISILQRLPLDKSIRYAFTTITSYIIVLLGLIFAFNAISIGWSKIQWLATALTFGLAFGLQEIFANFVAGLILLFERPIRVGDIVTVDDITGVVSRIRIRATTITNWDRKEYVVPNKEFITGRMLNWTLSDKVNRIVINVGIAYGSNVEKAKEILFKTCNDHPMILEDPETKVTFEGFGENSLNLVVRTFLPDMDQRLPVIDDLHTAIDQAFRQQGIEISFPQRDLHLRSVDSEVLRHMSNDKNKKSA